MIKKALRPKYHFAVRRVRGVGGHPSFLSP